MEKFLMEVEDTSWSTPKAASLFDQPFFFKEISSAWFQITGKDFLAEALNTRRAVNQARTVPTSSSFSNSIGILPTPKTIGGISLLSRNNKCNSIPAFIIKSATVWRLSNQGLQVYYKLIHF